MAENCDTSALNSAWDDIKKESPKDANEWLMLFVDKGIDALFQTLPYLYKIL